ncbi:MAG: GNAT family N-acetyltransferase, partial [Simkaniaceae bacterium]|nr:GNAT family N-acetyltransferase [Simkaniaceae bacterium]
YFACGTDEEIDLMTRIWMGYSRYKCALTAVYDGKPCGMAILFLMPYKKVAHHCMAYVVVPPEFQKKGVGTALVKNIVHLGHSYFRQERIHFEIFGDSPLLKIMEKQKYNFICKQDNYIRIGDKFAPRQVWEKVYL